MDLEIDFEDGAQLPIWAMEQPAHIMLIFQMAVTSPRAPRGVVLAGMSARFLRLFSWLKCDPIGAAALAVQC